MGIRDFVIGRGFTVAKIKWNPSTSKAGSLWLHNHIIMNAVNFENFHKINYNRDVWKNKLTVVNDKLAKEYGLSVIEPVKHSIKNQLIDDMEKAISSSDTFENFLHQMEDKNYEIKLGKHLAFKNPEMKKFMRADTISLNYSIISIKNRIENNGKKVFNEKRSKYENKISYSTIRKKLKAEIDSSIRKANSFEDFIADLEKKGIEVKLGKHISFKSSGQERFIRGKSIDKNLSYHYTEDGIKFRIKYKEEYKKMKKDRIDKVMNREKMNSGLSQWAAGVNGNIKRASRYWIFENVLHTDYGILETKEGKKYDNEVYLLGVFLEKYEEKKKEISELKNEIEEINSDLRDIFKMKKTLSKYWELKKDVDMFQKIPKENMTADDKTNYSVKSAQLKRNSNIINELKEKGCPTSIITMNKLIEKLNNRKNEIQDDVVRKNLEFEQWENIKYNYNNKEGWNISDEEARQAVEVQNDIDAYNEMKAEQSRQRKENIKNAFKNIFK